MLRLDFADERRPVAMVVQLDGEDFDGEAERPLLAVLTVGERHVELSDVVAEIERSRQDVPAKPLQPRVHRLRTKRGTRRFRAILRLKENAVIRVVEEECPPSQRFKRATAIRLGKLRRRASGTAILRPKRSGGNVRGRRVPHGRVVPAGDLQVEVVVFDPYQRHAVPPAAAFTAKNS